MVLLLDLPVILDLEQDVGVGLFQVAIFFVKGGLFLLEGEALVSVGLFFVLAGFVVVADLLVTVLHFLDLLS